MSHAPPAPPHRKSSPITAPEAPSAPARHIMTRQENAEADTLEAKLSEPPIAAGVTETTAGAAAGAALGAIAGPLGMVAGAIVGAAAGAIAASAAQNGEEEKAARDLEIDEEIGVLGGELGTPNLKHPPVRNGAFSAGSCGVGSGGGGTMAEGPIPAPED